MIAKPHQRSRASVTITIAAVIVFSGSVPAYAAPGDVAWAIDTPAKLDSAGQDIAVTPDGATVVVAGQLVGNHSNYDYFVGAYSTTDGSTLWTKRYDDPTGGADGASAVAIDSAGTFAYVTGAMTIQGHHADITTMAFDVATGDRAWISRFNGPNDVADEAHGMSLTDVGLFIVGSTGNRPLVLRYASGTGALRWRTIGTSGEWWSDVVALGSRSYIVGNTSGANAKIRLAGFSGTGKTVFSKGYVGPFSAALGNDAALSPDGSTLFAFGQEIQGSRTIVAAFSTTDGSNVWHQVPQRQSGGFDEVGRLAVSPSGTLLYAALESDDSHSTPTYETIAYNTSDGTIVWGPIRENGFNDRGTPLDIAVSADGSSLYVTGNGTNGGGFLGLLTVAYDAVLGGTSEWEHWTEGPTTYAWQARAVAVAPDNGRVFVTGQGGPGIRTEAYTTS
jgi:hypothetical protein